MILSTRFAKASIAAGVAAMTLGGALAAPSVAAAQSSGYYDSRGGYNYDPCRRDQVQRGTTGAIVGGIAGAVIGSQLASRGVRTEGSVLGGAVGAAAGAAVGSNSAACRPGEYQGAYAPPPAPPPQAYYDRDDDYRGGYAPYPGYDGSVPYGPYASGPSYYQGYGDDRYDSRYDDQDGYYSRGSSSTYAYDRYGRSYTVTDRAPDANGCSLAESPIYLPDGTTQTRFVRVCRDRSGRYQVVD